ncbi:parasitic phase-specific protein PSP-1 [Histoplasma capsulatum]|uniref:Parasitic phase-specific protein PSP-1 n=1 Tax=Ajellomyces capsulatus TaxID=5037 RepID=A0A8A1M4E5_AJECA|nr:parasitic phase-specific protein PSP-1 [Histoplasma capsulatum]
MAGIGLQVGVLSLFGIVALDYYWRVSRYHRTSVSTDGEREAWRDGKFRNFAGAVSIAYLTIYARCVYRNPIMRHEPSFIVMESVISVIEWPNGALERPLSPHIRHRMILIAAGFLSCFPAGILFPRMGKQSCTPKT